MSGGVRWRTEKGVETSIRIQKRKESIACAALEDVKFVKVGKAKPDFWLGKADTWRLHVGRMRVCVLGGFLWVQAACWLDKKKQVAAKKILVHTQG